MRSSMLHTPFKTRSSGGGGGGKSPRIIRTARKMQLRAIQREQQLRGDGGGGGGGDKKSIDSSSSGGGGGGGGGGGVSHLSDAIFGAVDGSLSTFAIAAGGVGAGLTLTAILLIACSQLFADGFVCGMSNYMSTTAEREELSSARNRLLREIRMYPRSERRLVRAAYAAQGFTPPLIEHVVDVITADEARWIDCMVQHEYGLPLIIAHPAKAALWTFLCFLLAGAVPLLPYVLGYAFAWHTTSTFVVSAVATAIAFFAIGVAKARFLSGGGGLGAGMGSDSSSSSSNAVMQSTRGGVTTLGMGAAAATVGWLFGFLAQLVFPQESSGGGGSHAAAV
jgi:VIT1/CCC1 family predicted Fe2+/Mn2+ transporter